MKKSLTKFSLYLAIFAGALSCTGANLYKDMASNKTSDEALFEDAQKLVDAGDYTGAINKLLATTEGFQAQARVKESLAGAYAARCGMEFLTFVTNLGGDGGGSFFKLAMNGFVGVSTEAYADCKTAESLIEGIDSIGNRTSSQNIFLMFLEMAKIGNRLRAVGDVDPATGDGTVDAGFDCMDSVPIADAQEVIESFAKFLSLFADFGNDLAGGSGEAINELLDEYPELASTTFDYSDGAGPGSTDDPDEFDRLIIVSRALINSQAFGIGSCNDEDPTQCLCTP